MNYLGTAKFLMKSVFLKMNMMNLLKFLQMNHFIIKTLKNLFKLHINHPPKEN